MRIQGGKYRSRQFKGAPPGANTRPILARIKKSLFDILHPRLAGCRMLDLYAGTGSVGIEALSQGASRVTFVDNDWRCVKVIEENLKKLHETHYDILKLNLLTSLHNRGQKYDIIFMGPPYKTEDKKMLNLTGKTLRMILREDLLASQGIIVAQHHVKEQIEDIDGLELARRKTYGDSHISFYKHTEG